MSNCHTELTETDCNFYGFLQRMMWWMKQLIVKTVVETGAVCWQVFHFLPQSA
jgi:hypothetical protein